MQPKISVIVPVYNGRAYLANCIESLEAQTYANLEILLIDDGSTDGTDQVCQSLAQRYSNILVKTLGDEGVSAARNAGLDMASGAYVTFVDADDRLRPDTLSILYRCMEETGCQVAGCGFIPFGSEAEWEQIGAGKAEVVRGEGREQQEQAGGKELSYREYDRDTFLREGLLQGNSRCWSKLYRKSVVEQVRFRAGLTIGEDMLFLTELLPGIKKLAEVDYKGYGYFQNPRGAMNREFKPAYMDQIACWEMAREQICKMDRDLYDLVTVHLLMAILLTAGKLALLSKKERWEQRQFVEICHQKLLKEKVVAGTVQRLSKGYRIKVAVFGRWPWLYLWLYHFRKYRK